MFKSKRTTDIAITLLSIIAIFFLWNSIVLYPLKILVVFFHESSHAIATLLTGGKIISFEMAAQAGGQVISSGGNRFITLSSGYLGSMLWGVTIFSVAVATNVDRFMMALLGSLLIITSFLFSSNSFAILFGIIMGIAMLLSAKFLSMNINDSLLRIIGLTSMLYVPLDIYSDTIARSHLRSDAFMLAQEFGGTTIIWGSVWLFASILLIVLCFRWLFKTKK
ncbi:MAG: M50 family metallopeptidase [Kangiellaceae bacterium]|nr:M50 family metallopeptidase [Kangiellaceae bacterium]